MGEGVGHQKGGGEGGKLVVWNSDKVSTSRIVCLGVGERENPNPVKKSCGVGGNQCRVGGLGGGLGAEVNTEMIGLLQHPS